MIHQSLGDSPQPFKDHGTLVTNPQASGMQNQQEQNVPNHNSSAQNCCWLFRSDFWVVCKVQSVCANKS